MEDVAVKMLTLGRLQIAAKSRAEATRLQRCGKFEGALIHYDFHCWTYMQWKSCEWPPSKLFNKNYLEKAP
jgi:hypothetical protein